MKIILLLSLMFLFNYDVSASSSTIVIDQISGRVLYESNGYEKKLIASTTKIMTAIIVLEQANIDDEVVINESILTVSGSSIYLEIGEKIKIIDLLYGLMLRSGNDAAVSLATYISKSEDDFAKLMNEKANLIGMHDTNFINSSGLENEFGEGNISTAYDMALLMKYAMNNDVFKKIVSTKNYKANSNKKSYSWKNKNKLLFNYKYTTGGKTGYTKKSKRVLVTSACKDGKQIIIVTINDSDDFNNHKLLYEKLFKEYYWFSVLDKNINIFDDYKNKNGNLFFKNNYGLLIKNDELKNIKVKTYLYKMDKYYNEKVVGKIEIVLNDNVIHEEYVYFKEKNNNRLSFMDKLFRKIKS